MTAPAYLVDAVRLALAIDLCILAYAGAAVFVFALCRAAGVADELAERMAAEHGARTSGPAISAETGNADETSALAEAAS